MAHTGEGKNTWLVWELIGGRGYFGNVHTLLESTPIKHQTSLIYYLGPSSLTRAMRLLRPLTANRCGHGLAVGSRCMASTPPPFKDIVEALLARSHPAAPVASLPPVPLTNAAAFAHLIDYASGARRGPPALTRRKPRPLAKADRFTTATLIEDMIQRHYDSAVYREQLAWCRSRFVAMATGKPVGGESPDALDVSTPRWLLLHACVFPCAGVPGSPGARRARGPKGPRIRLRPTERGAV